MADDTLDAAAGDLAEARRTLVAVRETLEAAPDDPRLRELAARLGRIAAEVDRAGQAFAGQVSVGKG
jgi:hypothetical protein